MTHEELQQLNKAYDKVEESEELLEEIGDKRPSWRGGMSITIRRTLKGDDITLSVTRDLAEVLFDAMYKALVEYRDEAIKQFEAM